ncbi:malate dehydrogenase (quinone) [Novosphingobium sp. YJ-S2-02]|uniref:Probable malate:quinone oxidoreductase n=1 Tax=Novosphingobium aureum TaxID=2792964 RepID=A0A931HF11_9SPHN|nr:malate dehydrogenase (quinone) [Novosphingobium aureum]MBH0114811.1 malate dehydrogenase (quinone) [Novosphingobium aureum]
MKRVLKIIAAIVGVAAVAGLLFLFRPVSWGGHPEAENEEPVDVVLIGGGIMSVTLATYLQEMEPDWNVHLYERMDQVAEESSNGWNNAGTGHSGFAELNYTPENPDGTINIDKAVRTAEQFEVSRQFWAHEVKAKRLPEPGKFINPTAHMAFVFGDERADFLRRRQQTLTQNPLFYGMQYSTDAAQIAKWAPIMMEGRAPGDKIAATYMPLGTDVDYGVITRGLAKSLTANPNFHLELSHEVRGLHQNADKTWNVTVHDLKKGADHTIKSKFVFIGAGGAALKLLQLSGIPEAKDYAGFPVGGQFLAMDAPAIAGRHQVKAYGMADEGSPPMSVPHLDARKIDGKPVVLFGPFALQSTKFLKHGSWWDLFSSVYDNNVGPMVKVGADNIDLVGYLAEQASLGDADRQAQLQRYFPNAKRSDWKLITAGQRVQIIKRDPVKGSILQFGTEIVADKDGTIAALMGASPGASTSPAIMLNVMKKAFPAQVAGKWKARIDAIYPAGERKLADDPALTNRIRKMTSTALKLPYIEVPEDLGAGTATQPANDNAPAAKSGNLNNEMQAL